MEMTKDEIVRDYIEAKDKKMQIKILADLNLCRESEINAILREAGVYKRQTGGSKSKVWTEDRKEQVRLYLSEGLSVLEIAERMGLSKKCVKAGIYNYKLRELPEAEREIGAEPAEEELKGRNADAAYIEHLEKLLTQQTEKLTEAEKENEVLRQQNKFALSEQTRLIKTLETADGEIAKLLAKVEELKSPKENAEQTALKAEILNSIGLALAMKRLGYGDLVTEALTANLLQSLDLIKMEIFGQKESSREGDASREPEPADAGR